MTRAIRLIFLLGVLLFIVGITKSIYTEFTAPKCPVCGRPMP